MIEIETDFMTKAGHMIEIESIIRKMRISEEERTLEMIGI